MVLERFIIINLYIYFKKRWHLKSESEIWICDLKTLVATLFANAGFRLKVVTYSSNYTDRSQLIPTIIIKLLCITIPLGLRFQIQISDANIFLNRCILYLIQTNSESNSFTTLLQGQFQHIYTISLAHFPLKSITSTGYTTMNVFACRRTLGFKSRSQHMIQHIVLCITYRILYSSC